ncbi:MAG: ABC transporter permease, partial [Rhodothermales bacterium]
MFRNYFKIAYRNLVRHKGYAAINVFGLALGIACCLLIGLYVQHERSYDRFHTQADRIHRLVMEAGSFGTGARAFAAAGPYFAEHFPEVEAAVRFYPQETVLRQGEALSTESRFYYTDADVFDVFSYTLLAGDPASALKAPNSLVLTESAARRYFGEENPVGQTLLQGDGTPFQVTGVAQDPPSNTHLPFDFLASFETLPQTDVRGYQSQQASFIYLLLRLEADLDRLQERLDAFTAQDVETVASILGVGFAEMRFRLQPLTDIHLHSHLRGEAEANSDARLSKLFLAIALFLLLIAVINYMNLATARALNRAREVSVRKVVGAGQGQLAVQFLGEAMLLCLLAFALALGLAELLLPVFNLVTGKVLPAATLIRPRQWGWLTLVALGVGFVAGSYPALYLSRFRPVGIFKGDVRAGRGAQRIRQTLVAVQFTLSILLIIGTLVVRRQVHYLQSKDLGYDTEQILALPMQG